MEENKKMVGISQDAEGKNEATSANENQQKLSYEQLNEVCSQLYQQNQNLTRQLQQANMGNMFKRLDYLFLVLKYESAFNDREFVQNCVDEIKEAMTIPEKGDVAESDNKGKES